MVQQDGVLRIQRRIKPLKHALLSHPVYSTIDSIGALHRFMQCHVYAVWDFMSLLKALQRKLCCTDVPWLPPQDQVGCRLVNEIVLAEESDEDGHGGYASHFELYHQAMRQCGADTGGVDAFLERVRSGQTAREALRNAAVSESVQRFVTHTFEIIDSGEPSTIAAAFTFGREDLLPEVFQRIVDELNVDAGGQLEAFRYYLNRHIELDGETHGPIATRLVERLCGDDPDRWLAAEQTAAACLEARLALWDEMAERKVSARTVSARTVPRETMPRR